MEPYTPKPGTSRAALYDECQKFEGEFSPGDLIAWAEKKLAWSPHATRQEIRVLHSKGVLKRVSRGVYQTTTTASAPKPVRKIVERVVRKDDAETRGDRFLVIADAVASMADALKPLTQTERTNVLGAFGFAEVGK